MTTIAEMPIAERIFQLLQHLGIEQAHFGARGLGDLTNLAAQHPGIFASLTLLCPGIPSRDIIEPLANRLLVFHGDTADFDNLGQFVKSLPEARLDTLQGYVNWSDLVACHADTIQSAMLPFLTANRPTNTQNLTLADGDRGEVADITYHIQGVGPPLVLLPLGLIPSQWDSIMPALTDNFCTITLGGAKLGITALLERRATVAGYLGMVRTLMQETAVQPGDSILEVGCGTGALTRWLANYTEGRSRITGVDFNRYLLREAENLARSKEFEGMVEFEKGDAEELPYPDDAFDVTISVTMMEEVNADKALAEMVRVTKPGGKVGVIVRAADVPFFINMPLSKALKAKVTNPKEWVSAGPHGCADVSLYRRFQETALTNVKIFPHLVAFDGSWIDFVQASVMSMLDQAEAEEFQTARTQTEAEGTFIFSYPHHCAVGTKPF